jgi:hypothetical protein
MIMMQPSGSGTSYKHPNVFLDEPTRSLDFGWYAIFSDIRMSQDFSIESI